MMISLINLDKATGCSVSSEHETLAGAGGGARWGMTLPLSCSLLQFNIWRCPPGRSPFFPLSFSVKFTRGFGWGVDFNHVFFLQSSLSLLVQISHCAQSFSKHLMHLPEIINQHNQGPEKKIFMQLQQSLIGKALLHALVTETAPPLIAARATNVKAPVST